MRTFLLSALILSHAFPAFARDAGTKMLEVFTEEPRITSLLEDAESRPVNWAQPPLGCVEEMVPHRADRPCLDLTQVANPQKDWPANISDADYKYWYAQRRGLNICRSEEILRREKANPGSMPASHVQLSWMAIDSLRNRDVKVNAVYDASRQTGIPLHVLTGALYQESLFSELGIEDDGGNFSCGVQQINLIGWCMWANKQSASEKQAMGWPQAKVACDDPNVVKLAFIRPVFEIATSRLNGLPGYRLNKTHFANIPLESFVHKWPSASRQMQEFRYQLIRSFVENCSEARKGILAKAHELADIYGRHVSNAFKAKDRYGRGESFARTCREAQPGNAYPLHTGWLLAVSAYNAGPRSVDAVAHYNNWDRNDMNDPRKISALNPVELVTSLYWAGRYNPRNDLIEFNGLNGTLKSWTWFKGCVAQRHIARVMQHVTLLPEFFVDTLENGIPCARSTFDSEGNLIKTAVPEHRQRSSGRK